MTKTAAHKNDKESSELRPQTLFNNCQMPYGNATKSLSVEASQPPISQCWLTQSEISHSNPRVVRQLANGSAMATAIKSQDSETKLAVNITSTVPKWRQLTELTCRAVPPFHSPSLSLSISLCIFLCLCLITWFKGFWLGHGLST